MRVSILTRCSARLLGTLAVLAATAGWARADDAPACPTPSPSYEVLDWSDGEFQLCAPHVDNRGVPYPADFELRCTVFIGLQKVATVTGRPGQVLRGPHGRTGTGIATATCATLGGAKSKPAEPREVRLSNP